VRSGRAGGRRNCVRAAMMPRGRRRASHPSLAEARGGGAASKECTRAGALRRQRMPAGVAREASGTGASSYFDIDIDRSCPKNEI
jgi:hypothetical protein